MNGTQSRVKSWSFSFVATLVALVMLAFGGQLLFSGWYSSTDGGIHRFHEVAWGVIEGAVIFTALAVQIRPRGRKVAPMQQALGGGLALFVVMVATREFDAFTGVVLLLLVFLAVIHPDRSVVFRSIRPTDGRLTLLAVVAAVPLLAYAGNEIGHHLNASSGDPHAELAHYAGTAAAALAIPLVALVASFRTQGYRIALWSAGSGAVILGIASIAFPEQSSSLGLPLGLLSAIWGAGFVIVGLTRNQAEVGPPRVRPGSRPTLRSP